MVNKVITIGTSSSELALWHAHYLKDQLLEKCGIESEIKIIHNQDNDSDSVNFENLEAKNSLRIDLEEALKQGAIHVALQSLQDMPTASTEGLCLAGVSTREESRDALLVHSRALSDTEDLSFKKGATIGTSSQRQDSQLLHLRPDAVLSNLKGNVVDWISRLQDGTFDGIVLAEEIISRHGIDMSDLTCITMHPAEFVPAPAQGTMAYQCKVDAIEIRKMLMNIHQYDVADCTNVERKVLKIVGEDRHSALGVHCTKDANGYYHVHAAYSLGPDKTLIKIRKSQSTVYNIAEIVANELLNYKL